MATCYTEVAKIEISSASSGRLELPGGADWLVAVEVSPESSQERLGAAVVVLDVPGELVSWDLVRMGDGLAELGFEGEHFLAICALRELLE
jgi:hypothetical protein